MKMITNRLFKIHIQEIIWNLLELWEVSVPMMMDQLRVGSSKKAVKCRHTEEHLAPSISLVRKVDNILMDRSHLLTDQMKETTNMCWGQIQIHNIIRYQNKNNTQILRSKCNI